MAWNALTALILTVFFALHHNFTIFFCIKFATFNVADFPVSYQITSVTLMVMGNFKNLCVFNFVIPIEKRLVAGMIAVSLPIYFPSHRNPAHYVPSPT